MDGAVGVLFGGAGDLRAAAGVTAATFSMANPGIWRGDVGIDPSAVGWRGRRGLESLDNGGGVGGGVVRLFFIVCELVAVGDV